MIDCQFYQLVDHRLQLVYPRMTSTCVQLNLSLPSTENDIVMINNNNDNNDTYSLRMSEW